MKRRPDKYALRSCFAVAMMIFGGLAMTSASYGQDADSKKQQDKTTNQLRLQYARLNLMLVETELKLAEQYNRELSESIPRTASDSLRQKTMKMKQVPQTVIARLKSNVEIGKVQLAEAESPSTGSPEMIRKRYAEEKVQLAKLNLETARANKAKGVLVRDLEIARLKLIHDLAQLKLELLGSPENVLTIVDSLQRQIDRLGEEILTQDQRISALEDRLDEPK